MNVTGCERDRLARAVTSIGCESLRLFRFHSAVGPSDRRWWIDGRTAYALLGKLAVDAEDPAFTTAGSLFANLVYERGDARPANTDHRISDRPHDLLERGASFDLWQLNGLRLIPVDNLDSDDTGDGGWSSRARSFRRRRYASLPTTANGQAGE